VETGHQMAGFFVLGMKEAYTFGFLARPERMVLQYSTKFILVYAMSIAFLIYQFVQVARFVP